MSGVPSDKHSPAGDGSDDASGQQPAAKKRRTAASARGVANLTPEQLARKRANDREAQRAIRERTRNQIDTLNQRIRDLESQQPYRHLQAVVRDREAVVAENTDIKKRLESVLTIIQPILKRDGGLGGGLNELATAASHHSFNSTLAEIATATATPTPNGLESPPNSTENNRSWGFPGDAPTVNINFHGAAQHAPLLNPFSTLPRNTAPTCPLDALCMDFMSERRTRAAGGMAPKDLVGPAFPNFTAVVYPERKLDAHPLSKLHTDILRTFPDVSGLPEQVAIIYIMFLVMRWLVDPTQENYDRMPEWIQPRPSQLFIPHPFWNDYIPWPRMRDVFVSRRRVEFDTFFIPYTTTISVNWPHRPQEVLVPASQLQSDPSPYLADLGNIHSKDEEQWMINPAFEAHLRDLRNWSLGPAFQAAFPDAVDGVWIKDDNVGSNGMGP